jgi:hypothetical protein
MIELHAVTLEVNKESRVEQRVNFITQAGSDSAQTAKTYGFWVGVWARLWRWSNLVPIAFCLMVSFSMGAYCLTNWSQVTQVPKTTTIFMGGQIATPAPQPDPKQDQTCEFGWWALFTTISVNGLCAGTAIVSRWKVMVNGKHLDDLHKVAEGMESKVQKPSQVKG